MTHNLLSYVFDSESASAVETATRDIVSQEAGQAAGDNVIALPLTELASGNAISHPVPLADTEKIEVKAWGCETNDRTTPSGLTVELVDEDDTLVTSENTQYTTGDPVTTVQNDNGSTRAVYLRVANSSGTDFVDGNSPNSVGAFFRYRRV